MRKNCQATVATALWLLFAPVQADILLDGHQHIGDSDTVSTTPPNEFKPTDPVLRAQILAYPSNFHLSQSTTITGVRLSNAIGLDGQIKVQINGTDRPLNYCAACDTCTGRTVCGNVTMTLTIPLTLSAGHHTLAMDPVGAGNDIGISAITLLSAETTTSRMLNQRRHPGNPTDPDNDNDADDNYDITDPASPYYPDKAEGHPLDMTFSYAQNRRISRIEFYRVRDVDNVAPNQSKLFLNGIEIGSFPSRPAGFATEAFDTNFLALAGTHTLRVTLGVITATDVDSFSWDDIIVHSVDVAPAGALGAFNATDTGQTALSGTIKTKVSAKSFDLDIHAINALGTATNTAYTGTVTVEVLNASNNTGTRDIYGCRSTWTAVHTLGSLTFGVGNNGKKTLPNASYPNALREARIRVTDTVTGARGCSTDSLAIRPKEYQVLASDNTETTAGTARPLPTGGYSPTTAPFHKAGRPFTLIVTPLGESGAAVTGYDGQPSVSVLQTEPVGMTSGALNAGTWYIVGGTLRSDTASYSEVGAVNLRFEDTSFANIDLADGSTTVDRYIRKDDITVGRFIPDHFQVTKSTLDSACGTFSYIGQTFGYPTGAATLTAVSFLDAPTLNYAGTYGFGSKLSSIPTATFGIYDDPGIAGTPALNVPGGAHTVSDLGNGTGRILVPSMNVVRPGALIGSFNADIGIEFPPFTDSDGVAIAPAGDSPIIMGTATSGGGAAFTGGNRQMRYGRLFLEPSYGSERAALNMALRTEYFDGVSFVPGPDTCTSLQQSDVTLTTPVPGASPAQTRTLNPAGPGFGPWGVTLSAPNVAGQAVVDVTAPNAWLLDDNSDGDGLYNNNPRANGNFGLFNRSDDGRIYQREVFR